MSARETEIKLAVDSLSEIIQKIQAAGAEIQDDRHFEDNRIFDDGNQSLRTARMLLRLRTISKIAGELPSKAILTFKGEARIVEGVKDREEIECDVSPAEMLVQILSRLGYGAIFRYQKYRTVYAAVSGKLMVCVDETPIGKFLELEGQLQAIHEFALKLGYARTDYITESYAALYQQARRKNPDLPPDMIFVSL